MKLTPDELNHLYRYGCSLTGNDSDAYDLLHHAIERTMARGDQSIDSNRRYLMRAMRNRFVDLKRREARFHHESCDDDDAGGQAMDIGVHNFEGMLVSRLDLDRIWASLESQEREILFLWAVEGRSAQEIGDLTETSRNTVLSRIHRLRKKLLARFGESSNGKRRAT